MIYSVKSVETYERKRRRTYGRILNCVLFARYHHQQVYFLTLTSSTLSGHLTLSEAFRNLVVKIRSKYGFFEYCYIETNEGNGVLHVLFKSYQQIDIGFIRMYWSHFRRGAIEMRIERAYGSANAQARYLAGYLSHNLVCHFVLSAHMVFPKWTMTFADIIRKREEPFQERIEKVNKMLREYDTKGLYSKKYGKQNDLYGVYNRINLRPKQYDIKIGLPKSTQSYKRIR